MKGGGECRTTQRARVWGMFSYRTGRLCHAPSCMAQELSREGKRKGLKSQLSGRISKNCAFGCCRNSCELILELSSCGCLQKMGTRLSWATSPQVRQRHTSPAHARAILVSGEGVSVFFKGVTPVQPTIFQWVIPHL